MKRPTGITGIAYCYFSAHSTKGERTFRFERVFGLGVFPVAIGVVLGIKLGPPSFSATGQIIAVVAVLAAVLVGLLPLIHSVIGQADASRKYQPGERPLADRELDRISVLQDLHAAVSFSVIVLIVGLLACVVLLFSLPETVAAVSRTRQNITLVAVILLYSILCSTAFAFADIARGVFEAVENHAQSLKDEIENNIEDD